MLSWPFCVSWLTICSTSVHFDPPSHMSGSTPWWNHNPGQILSPIYITKQETEKKRTHNDIYYLISRIYAPQLVSLKCWQQLLRSWLTIHLHIYLFIVKPLCCSWSCPPKYFTVASFHHIHHYCHDSPYLYYWKVNMVANVCSG